MASVAPIPQGIPVRGVLAQGVQVRGVDLQPVRALEAPCFPLLLFRAT
ncbi:hypothetical protein [Rhizosaccharibacter radicis]|uniref:Uncharacterized protein n=1 Tax=Rhizosaccharibacter radicis TaxID=2782605 RepID=A0ABT1VUQ6_9PROT|nr:hypothetical protein [Acetobacteraceae bacterium KSS12]